MSESRPNSIQLSLDCLFPLQKIALITCSPSPARAAGNKGTSPRCTCSYTSPPKNAGTMRGSDGHKQAGGRRGCQSHDSFQAQGVRRVLVLTSSFHLPRALAVGRVVLGAGGMDVRGLGIEGGGGEGGEEGWLRRGRDYVRAWVWVVLGWERRGVVSWVHPTRRAEE